MRLHHLLRTGPRSSILPSPNSSSRYTNSDTWVIKSPSLPVCHGSSSLSQTTTYSPSPLITTASETQKSRHRHRKMSVFHSRDPASTDHIRDVRYNHSVILHPNHPHHPHHRKLFHTGSSRWICDSDFCIDRERDQWPRERDQWPRERDQWPRQALPAIDTRSWGHRSTSAQFDSDRTQPLNGEPWVRVRVVKSWEPWWR